MAATIGTDPKKKKLLIYAGIGLVITGIVSAFLAYNSISSDNNISPASSLLPLADNVRQDVQSDNVIQRLAMHMHVQLNATVNGRQVPIPKYIGIEPTLWKDHLLDRYGPQGMSPIHTHDASGTIHIESIAIRQFTFGEFADVWGLDLNRIASMKSDGQVVSDYRSHVLKDHEYIEMDLREQV